MKNVIPASITMIAYALGVLFIGVLTALVAPPGASSFWPWLIAGLVCVLATACAVMTLRIASNRTWGLVGIYAGLSLPLLVAATEGMQLRASLARTAEFNQAVATKGSVTVVKITSENRATVPHPVAYQTVGIGGTLAISALAFVALLVQRPRVRSTAGSEAGPERPNPATPPSPDPAPAPAPPEPSSPPA